MNWPTFLVFLQDYNPYDIQICILNQAQAFEFESKYNVHSNFAQKMSLKFVGILSCLCHSPLAKSYSTKKAKQCKNSSYSNNLKTISSAQFNAQILHSITNYLVHLFYRKSKIHYKSFPIFSSFVGTRDNVFWDFFKQKAKYHLAYSSDITRLNELGQYVLTTKITQERYQMTF